MPSSRRLTALRNLASRASQGRLISSQPPAPTVLRWNDSPLQQRSRIFPQHGAVIEHFLGIAEVLHLHERSAIRRYPPQSKVGIGPQAAVGAEQFHLRRVVNIVDLRIRSFEHEIAAPGLLVLPVNQYPAFRRRERVQIENLDGQPVVRYRHTVRRQSLLPIGRTLHCPQYVFKIPAHMPSVRPSQFCESHPLQDGQAGENVRFSGILDNYGTGRVRLLRVACRRADYRPVQRGEPVSTNLTPFRFRGIILGAISELARAKVGGDVADAVLQIFPLEEETLPVVPD